MDLLKRYKWTWLLLFVFVVAAAGLTYTALGLGKSKLPELGEVGDFTMENVSGEQVSRDDTKGKVRLMYFYFTSCPDVCPVTTFLLSQIQNELKEEGLFGNETAFVSISFDPETDTREKIKEYGDKFFADYSGWYFLRGDKEETWNLMRDSFKFMIVGDQTDNYSHSNYIALVDKNNIIRKRYNAADPDTVNIEEVVKDMKSLIKD